MEPRGLSSRLTMLLYPLTRRSPDHALVETVKAYATHESETFAAVVKARDGARSAATIEEQGKAESALTRAIGRLLAVAEAYAELRSVERFAELQEELTETEDKISISRHIYNDTTLNYNDAVTTFPSNLVARLAGFSRRDYFQAEGCPPARPLAGLPPLPDRLQPHGRISPGLASPVGAVPGLRYRTRRGRTGTRRRPTPRPARDRRRRQLLQSRLRLKRRRTHRFLLLRPRERLLQSLHPSVLFQLRGRR